LHAAMSYDIRARALQKIASLSATAPSPLDRSDLDRLCRACHTGAKSREYTNGAGSTTSVGKIPMVCYPRQVLDIVVKSKADRDRPFANSRSC
jgi:phosphatidylinositol 4-kinase